jgi:hypothetical protein
MKMPLILAALLAVVQADAAPEARALPRHVVTETGRRRQPSRREPDRRHLRALGASPQPPAVGEPHPRRVPGLHRLGVRRSSSWPARVDGVVEIAGSHLLVRPSVQASATVGAEVVPPIRSAGLTRVSGEHRSRFRRDTSKLAQMSEGGFVPPAWSASTAKARAAGRTRSAGPNQPASAPESIVTELQGQESGLGSVAVPEGPSPK